MRYPFLFLGYNTETMEQETRQSYIKRLWNANTADEISAILDEYDAKYLPQKPQPNWNEAPEWAQWWAVDANEIAWWYTEKPKTISSCWLCNDGRASCHDTIDLNGYDWRKTLTPRP